MSAKLPKVMILAGPNLGRLGKREPEIYGRTTWKELAEQARTWGLERGLEVECRQDDGEGEVIRHIHDAEDHFDGLILNAAAYTHTSVAVRDAVASLGIPCIEWHLSNPTAREEFRQTNLLAGVVVAGVFGFGVTGCRLALSGMSEILNRG